MFFKAVYHLGMDVRWINFNNSIYYLLKYQIHEQKTYAFLPSLFFSQQKFTQLK
jgi:hypothetical protein